jgi:16S rRNA (cytidine1402-2'-O)-methyltransferase
VIDDGTSPGEDNSSTANSDAAESEAASNRMALKSPALEAPPVKGMGFCPSVDDQAEEGALEAAEKLAPRRGTASEPALSEVEWVPLEAQKVMALPTEGLPTHDKPLAPGLYLVATPIGNLEDITLRALRVLRSVDRIACEDTRQTSKLLGHFGIRTPTVSYHAHNENARASELIETLKSGGRIAVVSDAGTPGIADPGATIAAEAIAAGIDVFPIPGANAALSALIASGLSAERFTFHGFLPSKEGQRRTTLEALRKQASKGHAFSRANDSPIEGGFSPAANQPTAIFYETPHRILDALTDIVAIFGPTQPIALARELTKLHEEFLRGTAHEILTTLQSRPSIRGEIVLLIDATPNLSTTTEATPTTTLAAAVATLMRTESLSEKDALKRVAKSRNISKSEAYRELQRSPSRRR